MYGGEKPFFESEEKPIEEVWVLSIPSFLWITVSSANDSQLTTGGSSTGRSGHTCTMWQEHRMIVLGGTSDLSTGGGVNLCDPSSLPIRLLDTSTYSWQTQFISNTTDYSVPSVIYDVIGGE